MVAIGSEETLTKFFMKDKDRKPMSFNMLKNFYKDLKDLTEERMET